MEPASPRRSAGRRDLLEGLALHVLLPVAGLVAGWLLHVASRPGPLPARAAAWAGVLACAAATALGCLAEARAARTSQAGPGRPPHSL